MWKAFLTRHLALLVPVLKDAAGAFFDNGHGKLRLAGGALRLAFLECFNEHLEPRIVALHLATIRPSPGAWPHCALPREMTQLSGRHWLSGKGGPGSPRGEPVRIRCRRGALLRPVALQLQGAAGRQLVRRPNLRANTAEPLSLAALGGAC